MVTPGTVAWSGGWYFLPEVGVEEVRGVNLQEKLIVCAGGWPGAGGGALRRLGISVMLKSKVRNPAPTALTFFAWRSMD